MNTWPSIDGCSIEFLYFYTGSPTEKFRGRWIFLYIYKKKKPQLISSELLFFFFSGGNRSKKSLSYLNWKKSEKTHWILT